MKRLLIALLSVVAGTVVGCVDENNEVQLPDQNGKLNDIVFGELITDTGECSPGDVVRCFSGPSDKVNVGICKAGYYECIQEESGKWVWDATECRGEVLPDYTYPCSSEAPEADFDCDGTPDNMQDEDGDGLTICSDDGFREDMCDVAGGCDSSPKTKSRRTNKLKALWTHEYPYIGSTQTVTLQPGTYKLEVWGAQGGGRNLGINGCGDTSQGYSGLGGYAAGTIKLTTETQVHINVGGAGHCAESGIALGGFNCGTEPGDCTGYGSQSTEWGGGGGGATDIRIGSNSLYSRVIVAGGGGGGGEDPSDYYGHGGGLTGVGYSSYDATQTSAGANGSFGRGASTGVADGGGGGGGWYGGGTYADNEYIYADSQGGGGGSGYVYTADTASYYPAGCTLNVSQQLTNTMLIDGMSSMPSPDGFEETGHAGNGFARISKLVTTEKGVDFDYVGHPVSYTLLPGSYRLEVWGAQGGHRSVENSSYYSYTGYRSGRGGYSVGTLRVTEPTTVYVRVGGQGNLGHCDIYTNICEGGFNGGGYRYMYKGGGGATDIRIGTDSLYSRVIVAGGGGSDGGIYAAGGAGGGYSGVSAVNYYSNTAYGGTGGLQNGTADPSNPRTTPNTTQLAFSDDYLYGTNYEFGGFGFGGAGLYSRTGYGGAGGGGWYGGNGVDPDCCWDDERGGGGGSGYVYTSWSKNDYPSGCLLSSKYYLKEADTYDGDSDFLDPDGNNETGHKGNGYARITPVPDIVDDEDLDFTDFSYSGAVQSMTLEPGKYRFQVWGAQGGYRGSSQYGGLGGYSEGVIELTETTTAYVYVGGSGNSGTCSGNICTGGFNGGGYRYMYKGGGGGTDIRLGTDSLYARVIVAGGGGSDGSTSRKGGYGGGDIGERRSESWAASTYCGYGGTQLYSGYDSSTYRSSQNTSSLIGTSASYYYGGFGFGGAGTYDPNLGGYGGAGGGGWYGGTGVAPDCCVDDERGGGGGSGYVFTEATHGYYPAGCLLGEKYYMTDAKIRSGNSSFKSPNGGNETGHIGNGFARITRLSKPASTISVQDFDYTGAVQHISLDPGEYKLEVWGAQGGDAGWYSWGPNNSMSVYSPCYSSCNPADVVTGSGGKGGYSTGVLKLKEKTDAYIYVGGAGTDSVGVWVGYENMHYAGGFNGGGDGNQYGMTGGGGASDIRLGTDNLKARVIVAGGGGGAGNSLSSTITSDGGFGGGEHGGTSETSAQFQGRVPGKGGTQVGITPSFTSSITAGFGQGGGGTGENLRGGGGGGWYGGTQGNNSTGAGGGSGYVYTSSTYVNYPSGCLLTSEHYLTEAYTMGGDRIFKAPNGSDEVGHSGNGHVRISKLGVEECHDYCVTVQDEDILSDTTCSVPTDTVHGVTPPTATVEYCTNIYDPDYCSSHVCHACEVLEPVEVDVPSYGSFYTFTCGAGSEYVSTRYRYLCQDYNLDMTYSYWGYSVSTPVNKTVGAYQLAKAMDICWLYDRSDPNSFGLIMEESEVTQGDDNYSDPASLHSLISSYQVAVKDGLRRQDGVVQISPRGGSTLAMLSTGRAADAYEFASPSGTYGHCGGAEIIPAVYADIHGDSLRTNDACVKPTSRHCDAARLHLKLKAPENAKGFSFEFRFFSKEYPTYVCRAYNDFFLALVTDEEGHALVDTDRDGDLTDEDGNIAFDLNGNPVTISSGFFTSCAAPVCGSGVMASQIEGCPASFDGCTDGHCGVCEDGIDDLYAFVRSPYNGSSGQGGGTGWLKTSVPINPGQVFNLDFFIWDTQDSVVDSSVLIDNFKWRTKATEVGTFITGRGEVVDDE